MTDYATLLWDHVTLECRSRGPNLPAGLRAEVAVRGLVCRFLCWQRDFPIPSSAAFGKVGLCGGDPLATLVPHQKARADPTALGPIVGPRSTRNHEPRGLLDAKLLCSP